MRILILNWRDTKNPAAGGAELLTHELATRWVRWGHEVTQFCGAWPGAAPTEILDGVRIIRQGNRWGVYPAAFHAYHRQFQGRFDVVVDEVNTVPFFTPWYVREPVVLHFNQMAREIWFYEAPLPVACVGWLLEPLWLRIYRRRRCVTISKSSEHDLCRLGFDPKRVLAIPLGAFPAHFPEPPPKAQEPTLLYVGRLKRSKRVDHILRALALIRQTYPTAQLCVIGNGDHRVQQGLVRLAHRLGVEKAVSWMGHVSEEEKYLTMGKAHAITLTSVREGWGLVVSEANVMGTPAITYDIHGLRDAVEHERTGLLCRPQSPERLAEAFCRLMSDSTLRVKLSQEAAESMRQFSWDTVAGRWLGWLSKSVEESKVA